MIETTRVEGLYHTDTHLAQKCFGEIEIIKIDSVKVYSAYVSWRIFDESGQRIASVSKNYFLGDKPLSNAEIFEIVIKNIQHYRIGRKLVFSAIKLIDN